MLRFPYSKINLGLRVLRKRSDAFHDIETIMYPIGLSDALEIIKSPDDIFRWQTSGIDIPGEDAHNLCVKAFKLIQDSYHIPDVKMHLHKNIPMGAGLGGGSSDAAFTLRMLNEYFGLGIESGKLKLLAAKLGSDCPFFIDNLVSLASGRGESLEPISLSLKDYFLLIVKPDIHITTAEAYANLNIKEHKQGLLDIIRQPISTWKESLYNDFESYVFNKHPEVAKLKSLLYEQGAIYASLTGSGSAIYGIFAEDPSIEQESAPHFTWKEQLK